MSHGTGAQAEGGGDGVGRVASSGAVPDDLSQRQGGRRWHEQSSLGVEELWCYPQPIALGRSGKTLWRYSRQNFMSQLTAKLCVG
jgi:hypothetical protein